MLNSFSDNLLGDALAYEVFSTIFIYIPALTYGGIWLTKTIIWLGLSIWNIFHWILHFQKLQSPTDMVDFANGQIISKKLGKTCMDLSELEVSTIRSWATSRKEVIQNKFFPITMLISILALFGTNLGNDFVTLVSNALVEYFSSSNGGFFLFLTSWGKLVFVSFIVAVPLAIIVTLFEESFVADFIEGICIFVEHERKQEQKEKDTKKNFLTFIWNLFE